MALRNTSIVRALFVVASCSFFALVGGTANRSKAPGRLLLGDQVCTEIPMTNVERTWEWATQSTVLATGMMVYQNGKNLFEAYEPNNVCRLCWFPPIRWLMNFFIDSGGSPTKKFSLYSGTKSLAGLAALMMVKQGFLDSLDDKVSHYVEEWNEDQDKAEITIRELLNLSSGIRSSEITLYSLNRSINSPFEGKKFSYGFEPFMVFSYIIELRTGRSGYQYLEDEVFSKLGVALPIRSIQPSGITNFYSSGRVTIPDILKLAEELLAAATGDGKIFNEHDIAQLTKPGLLSLYGLTFWLKPWGAPSCDDLSDVTSFSIAGAAGQVVTIVPTKQLILIRSSSGLIPHDTDRLVEFWNLFFDGVGCECLSSPA